MWKTTKTVFTITVSLFLICCKKDVQNKDIEVCSQKVEQPKSDTAEVSEIQTENQKKEYKQFKGAWFDIEYPSAFTAENSMKSLTNVDGFDSAVFTSPDGKVQFYVFSPQWSGEAKDILIDKKTENLIDSSEENNEKITVKRWVIEANNGSYHRAYEETVDNETKTNKVFGIKYNPDVYKDEYQKDYLRFKNSLVQYAD